MADNGGPLAEKKNIKVCIGIPCYSNVSPETLFDYMRLAYHIGRRLPQYDLYLAIKTKSEQFRARNGIVEAAQQQGCDYLLMLDDDHVIDWEDTQRASQRYDLIDRMIKHMQADEKLKIVGGLYYHRGGECAPVILKENRDGGFYYIRDDEVEGRLQEVQVTGGGCMMIDVSLFDKIPPPWFQIENKYGTDIQICQLARDYGFKVACDTSIVVGHVLSKREVVTPENRLRIQMQSAHAVTKAREQIQPDWVSHSALQLYKADAMQFAGWKNWDDIETLAVKYDAKPKKQEIAKYPALADYYRSRGPMQLARQVFFHFTPSMIDTFDICVRLIDVGQPGYGLDFGCGSAPVAFDYVLRGQKIDFVDIDGTYAYDFTKWRAKHRGVEHLCGWELKGPYDYIFLFDIIEHLPNWEEILTDICGRLRNNGALITNYFLNKDFDNPEHVSMDHEAVKNFLVSKSIYPVASTNVWVKRELKMVEKDEHAQNSVCQ